MKYVGKKKLHTCTLIWRMSLHIYSTLLYTNEFIIKVNEFEI